MKHPETHVLTLLTQLPLFGNLDAALRVRLAQATHERLYAKGEAVFRIGSPPSGLFIVMDGLVKESCISSDGREKILELIDAPHSFGESALFLDTPYPYAAATLEDSRILHIDKAALFDIAFSQPALAQRLLQQLSRRVLALIRDVETYSTHRHVQRAACYLLGRCDETTDNQAYITLPTSKVVIASRLGMTPETLSRNLHDLADAGLISVRGNRIRIRDIARLRLFAA